jgi:broad specificity phosphatase PhoE
MIAKNEEQKEDKNFSKNLSEKLLIMRHGETDFNADQDKDNRVTNPKYPDCRLNQKGISQAKSKQGLINSLSLEKVYVSPIYRALQTVTYCLENHPNKNNIVVVVHPLVSEISNCINDYILDIKQTKKDFNMNSKIKIDWSLFDEYVKNIKYDENFYYFDNFDCYEGKEMYQELKNIYNNGDIEGLRNGLSELATLRFQAKKRFESLKHLQGRFKKFCDYIREHHKDTLNDKKNKILVVSHCSYIKIGTDLTPYESEKIQDYHPNCYSPSNCEILSFKL